HLSAYAHTVPGAVVMMRRPLDEIHASEARVGWPSEEFLALEQARYFRNDMQPAELKYWAWDNIQTKYWGFDAFELEYAALAGHPLWVEKSERAEFKWD